MTLVQSGSAVDQTTYWSYGVSTSTGSAIDSGDIVGKIELPNPTSGDADDSDSTDETMTVDAQGQILTYTDPNGTKHAYNYDSLRRLVADTITTFGANVDQTVAKIGTAYDAQGNPYLTTSYDGEGGIVNQIMRLFNGFGQLTQEFQSASGAVDPATTPSVQYSYSTPAGYEETVSGSSSGSGSGSGSSSAYSRYISEANNSRLTAIIYPDSYTVNFTYNSGTDDAISRVSSLSDTGGTLASFTYQGLGTVMSTSFGSGINSAITLDQFANIASISWTPTGSDTPISAYAYTHDDDGNTLSKTDEVNADFSQLNTFNNVNEQTGYQEGTISGGTIASPAHSQSLDFDALGNIDSNTVDLGTAQTRTVNAQSEYTAVSGVTATPTYDNDGDMTTDSAGLQYVYSALESPCKGAEFGGHGHTGNFRERRPRSAHRHDNRRHDDQPLLLRHSSP